MIFGSKSEKLKGQLEQLEFQLEELETEQAATQAQEPHSTQATSKSRPRASRKPLPEDLPREVITHLPARSCCPDCGGALRQFGEDVSEQLERIPASYKVIQHVRPKFACAACEQVVQAAAPARPIDHGLPGPGLLAHVLVSKFADHLPLYRQSEIYAREGVDLSRSTLAGWVGAASELLAPLVDQIRRYVLEGSKIHADDTPVPVLAPGKGKTKTARLWTYVRDDRPVGDTTAPAVWFAYSQDRKGEHPRQHLHGFRGALQADAYAGFHHLYGEGTIYEVACWAHAGVSSTTSMWHMRRRRPPRRSPHRSALSNRGRGSWQAGGTSLLCTPGARPAIAGQLRRWMEGTSLPVHQERDGRSHPICALPLASFDTLRR